MIEMLGNIGDSVGSIGVVITLFYLAFHIYEDFNADEKGRFNGFMFNLNAALLKCPGLQEWWDEAKQFWPDPVGKRMDRTLAEYFGQVMSGAYSYLARGGRRLICKRLF